MKRERILFVTQWEYGDGLIQSTLSYIKIIRRISGAYCYLVTTNKKNDRINVMKKGGVIVLELPVNGKFLFLTWFFNIVALRKIVRRKGIGTVHGWCTPACAVALVFKLLNKRIRYIVDSYEPHAETMVETGTWQKGSMKFRVLFFLERLETRKADCFVFSAPGMENYILEKYKTKVSNYFVKPTCADLQRFSESAIKDQKLMNELNLRGKIVCVYAGKFGGLYQEGEVFDFIKKCEEYWGKDRFKFLLLSSATDDYINKMLVAKGIDAETVVKQFVPHSEIHKYIGLADFAISPCKPVPSRKYCSLIKNAEYWSLGLPIVIPPGISIDSDIIRENKIGAVVEKPDIKNYAIAIEQINEILQSGTRQEIYKKIRPFAVKYRNMQIAEDVYSTIYAASVV